MIDQSNHSRHLWWRILFVSTPIVLLTVWSALVLGGAERADADAFVVHPARPQIVLDSVEDEEFVSPIRSLSQQTDPDVIRFMVEHIVAMDTTDWPKGYRGQFLQDIAPAALISAHEHRIPPSIILGQAIFESGWGRSNLAANFNNLFGIKGTGEQTVKIRTFERSSRNRRYGKWARFRTFETRGEAILYHGRLLAKDRRYAEARESREDWRLFMEKASRYYASDPNYTKKLSVIVEQYGLDRWDELIGFLPVSERVALNE